MDIRKAIKIPIWIALFIFLFIFRESRFIERKKLNATRVHNEMSTSDEITSLCFTNYYDKKYDECRFNESCTVVESVFAKWILWTFDFYVLNCPR